MDDVVSATEARIHFGELTRRAVEQRKPIVVERSGQPHVVILAYDQYERLLDQQKPADWRESVQRARAQIEKELKGRRLPPPAQVLARAREERDEQLLAGR